CSLLMQGVISTFYESTKTSWVRTNLEKQRRIASCLKFKRGQVHGQALRGKKRRHSTQQELCAKGCYCCRYLIVGCRFSLAGLPRTRRHPDGVRRHHHGGSAARHVCALRKMDAHANL